MDFSDHQLLDTYATRHDPDAFRTLVERYSGMVFGTARRVTADAALAEDIAQEVFLELARRSASITGSLGAWLHRVAYNRALDANRRRETRRRYEADAADHRQRLADTAGWDELGPMIDAAINDLPEDLRQPLVQHYLLGRTQEDLAQEIGVCPTTVSRRIAKALKRVRTRLRKQGVTGSAVAALTTLLTQVGAEAAPTGLTVNLSKIGLAGLGGVGAGGSLTAVGAGGVAVLVAGLLAVLSAVVGLTAWSVGVPTTTAAMPAAQPTAAVHPLLGPVVGYVEHVPVHAGDLLQPLGWPEAPSPALGRAESALPLLTGIAHDQTIHRLLALEAIAEATPNQWQAMVDRRDLLRSQLVAAHGGGDPDLADRMLRDATGRSLDDTAQRQLDAELAADRLAAAAARIPVPEELVEQQLAIHGAAENRTPSSRQQILAQLRGALFQRERSAFDQQLLTRSAVTPAESMAQETWQWLVGEEGMDDARPAERIAAATTVSVTTHVLALSDVARSLLNLELRPLSEAEAGDAQFITAGPAVAWARIGDGQLRDLIALADDDPSSLHSTAPILKTSSRVRSGFRWGPGTPDRQFQVRFSLLPAEGGEPRRAELALRLAPSWSAADASVELNVPVTDGESKSHLVVDLGPYAGDAEGGRRVLAVLSVTPLPADGTNR